MYCCAGIILTVGGRNLTAPMGPSTFHIGVVGAGSKNIYIETFTVMIQKELKLKKKMPTLRLPLHEHSSHLNTHLPT